MKPLKIIYAVIIISVPFIVYFIGEYNYKNNEKLNRIKMLEIEIFYHKKSLQTLSGNFDQELEKIRPNGLDDKAFEQMKFFYKSKIDELIKDYNSKILRAEDEIKQLKEN